MKQQNITVVIVEANKPARIEKIKNDLSVLQGIVGGLIECVKCDGFDIIINEEGKLEGLEPNFTIYNGKDYIAGTAIFTGVDYSEGEFKSISEEDKKFILNIFSGRVEA